MGSKLLQRKIQALVLCSMASASLASPTLDNSLSDIPPDKLIKLTPESLVKEVANRSAAVVFEQLQWQLAERQVDIEKAIFEPEFIASLMSQSIDTPNSVEESLSRSFQSQYEETSLRLSAGVKGKVLTGGEWSVTYNTKQTESNVIDQFAAFDTEYRNTLQLQYKQPLLRDLGINTTLSKRHIAEFAREIAFLTYRLRLMETSGSAIQAYWNYYRAQELLNHWQDSYSIAERLFNDAQARSKRGLGAKIDVLEAETAVAKNKARVIRAKAELIDARNRILSLLNVTAEANPDFKMIAVRTPEESKIEVPVFNESLEKALNNWPPYLVAQEKVKSEDIQVKYSKNQLRPRLDLTLGVDMVGLDSESGEAFSTSVDGSSNSWYVGLEYSMPIMGNRTRKNQLSQSKLRERQAKLELSSVRRSLSNSLQSRLARVRNAEEELIYHRRDLELKRRLRDAEIDKVQRGRSDMRELFRQEEELMDRQRGYLRAVVEAKLAEAALDIAQGTLLAKYDIDLSRDEATRAVQTHIRLIDDPMHRATVKPDVASDIEKADRATAVSVSETDIIENTASENTALNASDQEASVQETGMADETSPDENQKSQETGE